MINKADKLKILGKVKKVVLDRHFNAAGIDYGVWAERFDAQTPTLSARDDREFEAGMNQLLRELNTSHTLIFHEIPSELPSQHTIGATFRRVPFKDSERWMFLDVFPKGAADRAGIRPGTILEAIDEKQTALTDAPRFCVACKYRFVVRAPGDDRERAVEVEVPYARGNGAQPPLVPPTALTHRMVEPGLGYLRIGWFTATMGLSFGRELDVVMADLKSQGCNRLIIDLRGNIGGGLGFARLASYLVPGEQPIGYSLTAKRLREGYRAEDLPKVPMPASGPGLAFALGRFLLRDKSLMLMTQSLGSQPFHKSISVLVNEFTNSAAEIVAAFASESRAAWVIGSKTAGSALGAQNLRLDSGFHLRLPVFGWFTSKGKPIESEGVEADIQQHQSTSLSETWEDVELRLASQHLAPNSPR
jgi:C-terminal processing protease CtpA/Prc